MNMNDAVKIAAVATLVSIAGCIAVGPDADPSAKTDAGPAKPEQPAQAEPLGVPARLEYRRRGSAGFCAENGQALTATIEARADGTFVVSGTRARWIDVPGDRMCPTSTTRYSGRPACVAEQPVTATVLTTEETSSFLALVADMRQPTCRRDSERACDWCTVESMIWDGRLVSNACCGQLTPATFDDSFVLLAKFIDTVIARAGTATTGG
jgi:hypothetical protein